MIKVTRIGFVNFWLFDDEEFDFYDGKLLLRGHNGAGKSVTMQSFIPLILDGNKSPARLDPFGTTDKHIEDYLLGGIDTEKKNEATAYLYMETYHEEKKKHITIGMGLHARQGRPVDFYGFAIEDGKRIGKDLFLYNREKVPLTKQELKFALGQENTIVEKTIDYKKMVNNLLFGFSSLDAYDEFINVLLQLRSPKLSKEYKPTKLMGILSTVLQPLTEEDLRPLSEAIEEMDKTKEKVSKLEQDAKQISYFLKTFNNYNEILLYQKSKKYLDAEKQKEEIEKNIRDNEKFIKEKKEELQNTLEQKADLEVEKTRLERQKENIDDKDLESKTEKRNILERELEKNKIRIEKLESDTETKKEKERKYEKNIQNFGIELEKLQKDVLDIILEIDSLSDEIKWNEIAITLKDLKEDLTTKIDFNYLETRLKNYQITLKNILEKLSLRKETEKKVSDIEENIEKITKDYQKVLEEIENIEENLATLLREVKDKILLMNQTNQYIKLREDEKNNIFSYLKMYDSKSFKIARELYEKIGSMFQKNANDEYYSLKDKKTREQEKLNELKNVLEKLKQTEEEEIPLDEEEAKTKEFLEKENIKYLEFYKAIDFKENVNEKKKDTLEQVLLTSSLLNAKIILPKDIHKLEGHKGVFLCKSIKKKKNLTEYLKAVENESLKKEEIEAVLESINIDELDNNFLSEKMYKMDYIMGFGSLDVPSKYIGVLKRKEEKLRKIKEQEEKIESSKLVLSNISNLLEKKKEEMECIEKEMKQFPNEDNLQKEEEKRIVLVSKSEIIAKNKDIEEKKLADYMKELENLVKDLSLLKRDIPLPLAYEVFESAIESTREILENLSKIKVNVSTYNSKKEMLDSWKIQIEELKEDMDLIYEELHELTQDKKKKESELNDLIELLSSDKYKDLAETLLQIKKRLTSIPNEIEKRTKESGSLEEIIKGKEETKILLQEELERKNHRVSILENFFKNEYKLHYCFEEKQDSALNLAKFVTNKLQNRKDSDKAQAESNFFSALNEYRLNLNEYNLSQVELFGEFDNKEDKELYQENRRFDVRAMYQGRKLSLYELSNTLSNAIEENHLIMTEQDRHLFEEILLKTIGNKIKERIISSQDWVKNINDIMNAMQKNSALSFGLIWKNKDAESMEEMDTKELVRIFKSPTGTVNKKDSEKLITHFRSKLARMMEYNGDTANYQSIIFDVLDYRNWFEFKMTYQRAGEQKKELTDKIFSVFSGGEKAKTMYIPLFAAVSAKLNGANTHTMRLVALDEAFAGVDESNIKEMFGILDSLELDYILTSQALTGDYDTIKEIAIAELLRPNNAQVVAIKRKKWNGKTMEKVLRKEITKDAINLF